MTAPARPWSRFALAITVFILLMMGVLDFGLAIYKYNGVFGGSARDRPRGQCRTREATSAAHRSGAVVATQQALDSGAQLAVIRVPDNHRGRGSAREQRLSRRTAFVSVTVTSQYHVVTPLLAGDRYVDDEGLKHRPDPAESKETAVVASTRNREHGQMVVILALALVAIIGMVGLRD